MNGVDIWLFPWLAWKTGLSALLDWIPGAPVAVVPHRPGLLVFCEVCYKKRANSVRIPS